MKEHVFVVNNVANILHNDCYQAILCTKGYKK